jgi:predicted Rossmann fold nucleotide-binding protein DprA/Smf involved in DNA uptake
MLSFGSRAVYERLNGLPREAMNVYAAIQSGYETAEEIMAALKLDAHSVMTALTLLELRGLAKNCSGKWSL